VPLLSLPAAQLELSEPPMPFLPPFAVAHNKKEPRHSSCHFVSTRQARVLPVAQEYIPSLPASELHDQFYGPLQ
jgi:hypothetical protein